MAEIQEITPLLLSALVEFETLLQSNDAANIESKGELQADIAQLREKITAGRVGDLGELTDQLDKLRSRFEGS